MKEISRQETLKIFAQKFEKFKNKKPSQLTKKELVEMICSGCPFYKPDGEELECGAFRIISELIVSETLKFEDIEKFLRENVLS